MDVDKTSSDDAIQKLYAEIAEKTIAAIKAEKPPSQDNKDVSVQPTLPSLPRYQPPPPPARQASFRDRICRMFFPASGHLGFDTMKLSDEYPPLDVIRQMILYETRLRLCDSIQQLMDEYHINEDAVTYIHDIIQQHVVEYFGYHDVNAIRTALSRFPDDPIVQAAFYVKHNKITQGKINEGQDVCDVDLYTTNGQLTTLFSQINNNQPLLILAGSTS